MTSFKNYPEICHFVNCMFIVFGRPKPSVLIVKLTYAEISQDNVLVLM